MNTPTPVGNEIPDHLSITKPFSVAVMEYGTGKPELNRTIILEVYASNPLHAMIGAEQRLQRDSTTSKFIAQSAIDLTQDFYYP